VGNLAVAAGYGNRAGRAVDVAHHANIGVRRAEHGVAHHGVQAPLPAQIATSGGATFER
jgi:hypothetical protein